MKNLERLAEKYRLEAESYYYELEAKKNASNALMALSGIIIQMTKDIRLYELKHGSNANTIKRRELVKDLEAISDVFYPLWTKMDNAVSILKKVSREKNDLARELAGVKKELETIKKSFEEL